ncbi:MAG: multidrug efflux RND transporter permease subunit [bacterium]|jgi:multidrug efflux pump|nr:multidrug efflux RND transporter permease subunit [Betaproteobacteria bacterium]
MKPAGFNLSAPFIARPIATTLLTLAILLSGWTAFTQLPVSPLPQVDFPTIVVNASLPGASPETMAATVATPLERTLGRIAGVNEITSSSSLGSTRIAIQFDLSRDIHDAGNDVQAGINAARSLLPTGMPSNPTWRKVNPADAPIVILALTSPTLSRGQMYDAASTVLAQRLAQVDGVGQVTVGGSALPAVRVGLNPDALARQGLGTEEIRAAIAAANANRPKGSVDDGERTWQVGANDQARSAADYIPLIVGYRNGNPIRLGDIAKVEDSVQDLRNAGLSSGRPAVLLVVNRQPNANIIETVDRVYALLPLLRASIPDTIQLDIVQDRTPTIRASLREVWHSLLIAIGLVICVTFLFLGQWRSALVPAVAVPVSLVGTLAVMYLFGFSLNNLSLMALTIATGFVVDDAIIVLENTARHVEEGMEPMRAALVGASEVAFTVVSMTLSLIAVFIPILFMGGLIGRLFHEFAITLSAAVLVSLLVSLTVTPMMCARLLKARISRGGDGQPRRPNLIVRGASRAWRGVVDGYASSLSWVLDHAWLMLLILFATIGLNVWLYTIVPKGFFPQQDTGRMSGSLRADQSSSFQSMQGKLEAFVEIVRSDPAVENVVGFTGGGARNTGFMFITLKPLAERKLSTDQVIARLRPQLTQVPGAQLFLSAVQELRAGARQSNAQFQYTILAEELSVLRTWEPRLRNALAELPELADVNTDIQDRGEQTTITFDRDAAARLGLDMRRISASLNNAFGQRQVSTIYNPLNQYRVVMEVEPRYWQSPEILRDFNFVTADGRSIPLTRIATFGPSNTPLSIYHQGGFAAATTSFNLPPGVSLSAAQAAIDRTFAQIGAPSSIYGGFQGTAQLFTRSLDTQPLLILAAFIAMYIVLGMLYESTLHPVTILSTLPSAGVGALLALMIAKSEFNLIALIGVLLLIGIVKKNAIMMVDFALAAERERGAGPREAIEEACRLRLRPILMTTLAALFGALPLALGQGDGAELRQPLGIAIVGGLLVSQVLTLYTTPVVYLHLDRMRHFFIRRRTRHNLAAAGTGATIQAGEAA